MLVPAPDQPIRPPVTLPHWSLPPICSYRQPPIGPVQECQKSCAWTSM